jgi:hypothetical protein
MESHKAGFPPFPHSLEIPSGFAHSHGLGDGICLLPYPSTRIIATARGLERMSRYTDPLARLVFLIGVRQHGNNFQGRCCGQERGRYELNLGDAKTDANTLALAFGFAIRAFPDHHKLTL